jgi:group I intron endonuclease
MTEFIFAEKRDVTCEFLKETKIVGVYAVECVITGGLYVGSSSQNVWYRLHKHRRELRKGSHGNPHLQASWSRYGGDAFLFYVLEECILDDKRTLEYEWMNKLETEHGREIYNYWRHAGEGCLCMTEEIKKKISVAHKGLPSKTKGRPLSEETKAKLREAWKTRPGKPHTAATKQKISESGKGKHSGPVSDVTRARQSEAMRTRWEDPEYRTKVMEAVKKSVKPPHSPETKQKIADSVTKVWADPETRTRMSEAFKKRSADPVYRAKIGVASKGRIKSEETRKKLSVAMTGKKLAPHSDSTKQKISEANKGRLTWNKGRTLSEETKAKVSAAMTGRPARNKGIPHSEETRAKMRAAHARKKALATTK